MEIKSKSGDVKWTNLRLESLDSPKNKKITVSLVVIFHYIFDSNYVLFY